MVPYKFDLTAVINLPCEFKRSLKLALARCKAFKIPLVIDDAHYLLAELGDGQIHSLASASKYHSPPLRALLTCRPVFLQMTEKFSGVILLVSNQNQKLAPAIESRIDLRLHFPEINRENRYKIWCARLEKHGWSDDDLNFLAACDMNGHQMNSLEKLSLLLRKHGEEWMTMEHVQQVAATKITGILANKAAAMG